MVKEVVSSSLRIIGILLFSIFFIGTIGCSSVDNKEIDKCWDTQKTDLKDAIEYGKSLLDKDNKNIEVYRCLASAWYYYQNQDYKNAIKSGESQSKIFPNNIDNYYCLGLSYYNINQLDLAYNSLKKALDLALSKDKNEEIYLADREYLIFLYEDIGKTLEKMMQYDDAIMYYSKGLELARKLNSGKEAVYLKNIGIAYYEKGDKGNALNYFTKALKYIEGHNYMSPDVDVVIEKEDIGKYISYLQQKY